MEAFAIELLLKARLLKAGIRPGKDHGHAKLFGLLPQQERDAAEQKFATLRNIPMIRTTLSDVLQFSDNAFVNWRYLHEVHHVEASMGEMQCAFTALADEML